VSDNAEKCFETYIHIYIYIFEVLSYTLEWKHGSPENNLLPGQDLSPGLAELKGCQSH